MHSPQSCVFVFIYCFSFVFPSPILIELSPSITGVAGEDRIANPVPEAAAASGLGIDLSPSIVGVEIEDRIAMPSPAAPAETAERPVNEDGKSFGEMISIDGLFDPDVTSVDVNDERRAHTEEGRDGLEKKDRCEGSGCDCPPGFEGVEPFCRPIAAAGEEASEGTVEDVEIPMAFYEKIAGIKNVEEFINLTKIYVPFIEPFVVTDGPKPSMTTLPAEGCMPKKTCVSVRPKHRHPAEDVFPSSIDVERCGGCCGHPELACLPWSTEPMTVKLLKYGYNHDGTISNLGFTTTSVIRELKCKCVQIQT